MPFKKGETPVGAKPFKKGQSGNPAGAKPGYTHSKTRLRRMLDLVQKAKNPVTKEEEDFTVLELMDLQQVAKAMKGDILAYREILDRLEGKATQTTEHTGRDGGAIEVKNLTINLPDDGGE